MKHVKLFLLCAACIGGFTLIAGAQQNLPEIILMARNYKYIRSVDNKETAQPVKLLERKAAAYDVKNSEFYDDEYDSYSVSFYLPNGYMLAVYDQNGKLLNTAERFTNVALPASVNKAVATRYPNWSISKGVYRVKYENATGAKMVYKLVLENGSKRLRVKTNETGEFLD